MWAWVGYGWKIKTKKQVTVSFSEGGNMRIFKLILVVLILCAAYIGILWSLFKLPKSYTDILEERATSVSVVTNTFGAIIAILIAMKFFNVVRGQISEFYSEINHLKQSKMIMDKEKMIELGLGPHPTAPSTSAVMRYTTGSIKRERERLARIFAEERPPDKVASAILDDSYDDKVFKWNGPEVSLDAAPISYEEREKSKENNGEKAS